MADPISLLDIHLERPGWNLVVEVTPLLPVLAVAIALGLLAWRFLRKKDAGAFGRLELESADFGLNGEAKFSLKPNWVDRQVAYAIWVELSTRKIGLPIELRNDVVAQVYDSWFDFFGVTRELIKTIPVSRAAEPSTQEIIRLSVAVLNEGLRPHLTQWQARFRRWYDAEAEKPENAGRDPQDIQQAYPRWAELKDDLEKRNKGMIAYRLAMKAIVDGAELKSDTLAQQAPEPVQA